MADRHSSEQMHPADTGPDYRDADDNPASIVACPDCGQMEWWTQEEMIDHGHCRAASGPCEICEDWSQAESDDLPYKVYSERGEYLSACRYPEDASEIIAGRGMHGMTIRYGHSPNKCVWVEGEEEAPASESRDFVAAVTWDCMISNTYKTAPSPDLTR